MCENCSFRTSVHDLKRLYFCKNIKNVSANFSKNGNMIPVGSFPRKRKCSNLSENKNTLNVTFYRELSQHFTYPEPYFCNLLYFRDYGETRLRFNPISDTITKKKYLSIYFGKQLTGQANFCDEWQDWWLRNFSRVRNRLLHSSHLNFLHINLIWCCFFLFGDTKVKKIKMLQEVSCESMK
jgi:hypothetical protein